MGVSINLIVQAVPNYQEHLEPTSELMNRIRQHIAKEKCIDCTRFCEYFNTKIRIPYRNGEGAFVIDNNYKLKPNYPSCGIGISIFKGYFSSRHTFLKNKVPGKHELLMEET